MRQDILTRSVKIIALIVLLTYFLFHAKPFLVPVVFGALFSMLLTPVATKLEEWKIPRAFSVILSILLLLAIAAIIIYVLVMQISDLSKNASNIEQNVNEKIHQVREFFANSLGISQEKQNEILKKQQQSTDNKITSILMGIMASAGKALTNIVLVLVYIFVFMYFRMHLKNFVLKVVGKSDQENTKVIMHDARKVTQKYLTGLALMIISLWIMYSIGFSILGVKNAVFFAILCGLLEIVPFVGNLTGNAITILWSLSQGASMNMVLGILIVYACVQFFQTYVLEPMVVGKEVNIHPVFTILGIVAGELIWGISGMILAIPLMGITKIICDHVEPLKPYGYLLGEEPTSKKSMVDKIKKAVKKI